MNFNKSIISFLASANALKLQSKLNTEFFVLDMGEDLVNGMVDLGEGIYDLGDSIVTGDIDGVGDSLLDIGGAIVMTPIDMTESAVTGIYNNVEGLIELGVDITDYFVSPDGFVYDVGYIFSEDFGQDLLDAGEYVFTGELFVDGYDWASNGSNWLLMGSTLVGTTGDILSGDYTGAVDRVTDPANWDVDIKTDEAWRDAYDDYVAQYNEEVLPLKEQYDELVEQKAQQCDAFEPAVGSKPYTVYGTPINYTQAAAMQVGTAKMNTFYTYLTGSPTQEQCEEADCLNPCYGAAHETNCSLCFQIALSAEAQESITQEQLKQVCDACTVPPTEAEIPELMTFNEFKQFAQAQ